MREIKLHRGRLVVTHREDMQRGTARRRPLRADQRASLRSQLFLLIDRRLQKDPGGDIEKNSYNRDRPYCKEQYERLRTSSCTVDEVHRHSVDIDGTDDADIEEAILGPLDDSKRGGLT
jgi:hypothetical protein